MRDLKGENTTDSFKLEVVQNCRYKQRQQQKKKTKLIEKKTKKPKNQAWQTQGIDSLISEILERKQQRNMIIYKLVNLA